MYDLAIVGAGPSGATLARLIGNNYKVILIDRRELLDQKVSTPEKCCGGLIAPDAQYMLGKLGLGVPRNILVGPQLFIVRTIDIQNKIERYYQRHYINIDRAKFDSWLVSMIPPSVELRFGYTFNSYQQTDAGIKIKLIAAGKEYTEEARLVIGADGAFSKVRRQLAPQIFPRKYVAIQEWFQVEKSLPYYSAIFDRDITDFYAWTIPKADSLLVGAAIPAYANAHQQFGLLKDKLSHYGFALSNQIKKQGCYIIRPEAYSSVYLGEGNVLLIGEAAGWMSPTSAEGLSYSFRSAVALAQSLKKNSTSYLRDYAKYTNTLKLNIWTKRLKVPFMYNPHLRKFVMKSGITSMNIFDT